MCRTWHNPSASTTEVSGCNRTLNSVTTPKLPPPPRKAQNKSGFSLSSARTMEPSAVTRVNRSTLSHDKPNRRVSHPVPPPRISPEAPVCETTPDGKTNPAFWVAISTDPKRQPPVIHPRRLSGSILTSRILERSITRPSQVPNPARLWPPHRIAVSIPASEDARTASDQSRPPRHHTIPNSTRGSVFAVTRAQQVTFELLVKRAVNLCKPFDHLSNRRHV